MDLINHVVDNRRLAVRFKQDLLLVIFARLVKLFISPGAISRHYAVEISLDPEGLYSLTKGSRPEERSSILRALCGQAVGRWNFVGC